MGKEIWDKDEERSSFKFHKGKILEVEIGKKTNDYRTICSRGLGDKSKGICEAPQGLILELKRTLLTSCREVT